MVKDHNLAAYWTTDKDKKKGRSRLPVASCITNKCEDVSQKLTLPEDVALSDTVFFSNHSCKETGFLSNVYPSPFVLEGLSFATVEHFFQAMKFPSNPHY